MRQRDLLLLQSHQLSHHPQHPHKDQIDLVVFQPEESRYTPCLTPICSTPQPSLLISRVRSQLYPYRSMIYPQTRDRIQSPISSSLFGHSDQKKGENVEGELAQCQGEHRFRFRNIGYWFTSGLLLFIFSFYNCWFMFMLLLLLFKTLVHFSFINSILYSVLEFVTISMLCNIFQYFQILIIRLEYFTLVPQQDLVPRCIYFMYFALVVCWTRK